MWLFTKYYRFNTYVSWNNRIHRLKRFNCFAIGDRNSKQADDGRHFLLLAWLATSGGVRWNSKRSSAGSSPGAYAFALADEFKLVTRVKRSLDRTPCLWWRTSERAKRKYCSTLSGIQVFTLATRATRTIEAKKRKSDASEIVQRCCIFSQRRRRFLECACARSFRDLISTSAHL